MKLSLTPETHYPPDTLIYDATQSIVNQGNSP